MLIQLKGLSKRGKDRINSHGSTFKLVVSSLGDNHSPNKILVESINNTDKGKTKWLGWLTVDLEVEVIKELNDVDGPDK